MDSYFINELLRQDLQDLKVFFFITFLKKVIKYNPLSAEKISYQYSDIFNV